MKIPLINFIFTKALKDEKVDVHVMEIERWQERKEVIKKFNLINSFELFPYYVIH